AAAGIAIQDNDPIFPLDDGRPRQPQMLYQSFQRIRQTAGLPHIRFPDLRPTYATVALEAGVQAKVVGDILGHPSAGFTLDTYAHAMPTASAHAAALVHQTFDLGSP